MVEINAELVEKLIKNQFSQWSNLPIYPVEKGGNDNRTLHIGTEMSVRLPSEQGYVQQVRVIFKI